MATRQNEPELQPRKQGRQARAVETQERILDSARTTFAEYGYRRCTTNRIAQSAGVSIGSLYQYFPNKDAILAALMLEHIETGAVVIANAAAEAQRAGADFEGTLRTVIAAFVALHASDRRLHAVLFEEAPRLPVVVERMHEIEQALSAATSEQIVHTWPDIEDPELVGEAIVATIEALVHHFVASERPVNQERVVTEITAMLVAYLDLAPRA